MDTLPMTTDFQELEKASPFPYARYEVDVGMDYLERHLEHLDKAYGLDLNPDFQRAHVWTEAQQEAFVRYLLQDGPSGRTLYFACRNWDRAGKAGPVVVVDGKQRLEAVRAFMRNDLAVNGKCLLDWTGHLRFMHGLRFAVADLDYADTLRWYLALNEGGTPHAPNELDRVRALLHTETRKVSNKS